jgi:glucose/arabinose dehydrogenase
MRRIILISLCVGLFLAVSLRPIDAQRAAFEGVPFEPLPPGVVVETVVPSARYLVAMDFTPDGRLLYTERVSDYAGGTYRGYVRAVVNGLLQPDPVFAFPVLQEGERGLLGIAVDPNFTTNHYVWVYLSRYSDSRDCRSNYKNRVVRFVLSDDNLLVGDPDTAGCFPIAQYETIHNGGNLHFGPDGKLYITVGNNDSKNDGVDPAQDLNSPLGKLHRFNASVPLSAPGDNPLRNTSIFAYGLRNTFDFDFDPITGQVFATENGDACDDEINRLVPGGNYGWRPNYPCDDGAPGGPHPQYNTIPPLIYWSPSIAPTGITFYRGNLIPEWKNDLFMCAFKDGSTALHHFKLNAARTAIVAHTVLSDTVTHQPIRCRTDVLTGPDGALYYSEGGGYYDGPIKRLSRTTSFTPSTVSVNPAAVRAGDVFTYTIKVSHVGTLSNTFNLVAALSPRTTVASLSPGMQENSGEVSWSGLLTGIQSVTGTIAVRVTDPMTTPYLITIPLNLYAPNLPAVNLRATTLVNGLTIFLPLVRR